MLLLEENHVTRLRSEVEGSCLFGRIGNIPLDFKGFLTISQNMWYQYHMCSKTKCKKKLKISPYQKLKIREIRQIEGFYTLFFIEIITTRVFYTKQYWQRVMNLKTYKIYINRVLTTTYCYQNKPKIQSGIILPIRITTI